MNKATRRANQLLSDHDIVDYPVPVEELAEECGATISYEPFDGNLSGMLVRQNGRNVIGVNSAHKRVRQRFTIAHEIGHLLMHKGKELYLDQSVRVNNRDSNSSMATDKEEIEANQFASELLMPEEIVRREVGKRIDFSSGRDVDELIEELASVFQVSLSAMQFRLINLGII